MKKRGGGGEEGGSWMDTYGDLVTLLLTFFVLLYSMSSVDNQKWDLFVRSIYPDGKTPSERAAQKESAPVLLNEKVTEETGESREGSIGDASVPESTIPDGRELYLQIAEALKKAGVSDATVTGGENYTFVVFKDKTFFGGDSSMLTEQGKHTLDIFCDTIADDNDMISQMNIMGHTAQANPKQSNSVRNDRILSALRAAEVSIYIQEKNVVDPEKLVSIGYGQYRPLESNETAEGRAANRRVEILIVDKGGEEKSLEDYYKDIQENINGDTTIVLKPEETEQAAGAASETAPAGNTAGQTGAEAVVPGGSSAGKPPEG